MPQFEGSLPWLCNEGLMSHCGNSWKASLPFHFPLRRLECAPAGSWSDPSLFFGSFHFQLSFSLQKFSSPRGFFLFFSSLLLLFIFRLQTFSFSIFSLVGSYELLLWGLFIHARSFCQLSGCPWLRQRTKYWHNWPLKWEVGFHAVQSAGDLQNHWTPVRTSFNLWVQRLWKAFQATSSCT